MSGKQKETKPTGKRKRTVVAVLVAVLIIVAAVLGILAYRFRSHINAAVIWLTTSEEDIQKNIDKAKNEQEEALKNVGFNASKELDEALQSGKITPEEHTQILLGYLSLDEVLSKAQENTESGNTGETVSGLPDDSETENDEENEPAVNGTVPDETKKPVDNAEKENTVTPNQNGGNKDNQQNNAVSDKPAQPNNGNGSSNAVSQPTRNDNNAQASADVDKRIAELVTKMYVLKAEYTSAVDGIVASMKAEYSLLPPEKRNTSAKADIASGYLGQINAMEAQCDAQVNAIVTELRQLLKNNGRDMSLADAILTTYATEKENTKAYYISTYGD